jgi:transcriptional regulator with XRE-family HTH domain
MPLPCPEGRSGVAPQAAAGLTQQELASKAGLSISGLVQIELGTVPDPRVSTLRALAKALGVSLDELAGEEEETPPEQPKEPPAAPPKRPGRRPKK